MAGGYYHTGDVAARDDEGYITYVGRTDDVFKASDYRISPFELESVLIEHEAVAEAAVVPSPDPLRLAVPKAYVALAAGPRADARDGAGDPALRARAPRAVQARPPAGVRRAAEDDLRQDPPRRAARRRSTQRLPGGRRRRGARRRVLGGGLPRAQAVVRRPAPRSRAARASRPHQGEFSMRSGPAGAPGRLARCARSPPCCWRRSPSAWPPAATTTTAPSSATATPAAAAKGAACDKASLALKTPGTLTVGTDKPAYPPYFEDDDPTNGKGFESAVAYAVAEQLGFAKDEVKWTVVPFNSSYAPGPEEVRLRHQPDLDHAQARRARRLLRRRTTRRRRPSSRSKDSPAASATSLADLKDAKLGVQVGTTSLDAVERRRSSRRASRRCSTTPTTPCARSRPSRSTRSSSTCRPPSTSPPREVPDGEDRRPVRGARRRRLGRCCWRRTRKLTACVNQALGELKASGELQQITDKWMGGRPARPSCNEPPPSASRPAPARARGGAPRRAAAPAGDRRGLDASSCSAALVARRS